MKACKHYFNLIEIVLTVAVVAFGVVIILGMLPKGMTATRNVAAVSYASSVIDQIGGALQQHGADSINSTAFNSSAISSTTEKTVTQDYPKLVMYIDNIAAMPSALKDKYIPFATGVFKCEDLNDVYLVVMGNSEEIDGERINNIDFSGMIRVCKKDSSEGSIIKLAHSSHDENHTCLKDSDGSLQCSLQSDKHVFETATVYIELSFPLSRPYDERQKMYYSFDAKK